MVTEDLINNVVNKIYYKKTKNKAPCNTPFGCVLGGQPAAGKSVLTEVLFEAIPNIIVINGDEFRSWHPDFNTLQKEKGKDSVKETAAFAGKVTEAIINRAVKDHYNVIIEGTFRTAETPLKTLKLLKDNGYQTAAYIKTCDAELSWKRCNDRYQDGLKKRDGKERYTFKDHHDLVVSKLPENADIVYKSGLADKFVVIGEQKKVLFDSKKTPNELPSNAINKALFPKKEINLDR